LEHLTESHVRLRKAFKFLIEMFYPRLTTVPSFWKL
jgi:hypothetical protein